MKIEQSNCPPDHTDGPNSAYCAYLIERDGRIGTSLAIMAQSDADGLAQAQALTRAFAIELWDRSRIVARLPAETQR